jgi:hypothetical protein
VELSGDLFRRPKKPDPYKFFEEAAEKRLPSTTLTDAQKRRIAAEICIPADRLLGWFCDALQKDDPKPTLAACEALAREFQTILNRRNNEEKDLDPSLPDWLSKDPVQMEWEWKQKEKVTLEGSKFLVLLEELESVFGPDPYGGDPN